MIKKLLFSLFALSLLAACTQDELPTEERFGYLSLNGIGLQDATVTNVNTRAVDESLYVEIRQGDEQIKYFAPSEVPADPIKLPVGTYTLRAYNEAYTSGNPYEGLGQQIFFAERTVDIAERETPNEVRLTVPMTNLGIRFTLDEGIESWFNTDSTTLTVTLNGGTKRTVTLHPDETAYFDPKNATGFTYSLHLVNTDGEKFDPEGNGSYPKDGEPLAAGKIYEVKYSVNKSLEVSNN